MVLQDAGMVAFYEKNGYHQNPYRAWKKHDAVYMKNDREISMVRLNSKPELPYNQSQKINLLSMRSVSCSSIFGSGTGI